MPHVLVLGGGIGGVVAAEELRKRLPRKHRITLVDREEHHLFAPSLLWLMTGGRTADRISRPLARLARKGIEVVRGEITGFDPARREVRVGTSTLAGDVVVVALGAELDEAAVPGLSAAGHDLYTLAGAESFRRAFESFGGGRIVVLTAAAAYKCPAAPYEAAMLLEAACRKRGLRGGGIALHAAEAGPMGVAGAGVSAAVRGMVESKGIAYHPEHVPVRVEPEAKRIHFANGSKAEFDLLLYVPPHRAPRVLGEAGLLGETGWIPVDRHSLATEYEGVYAIGDAVSIPLALGKPLPKAGVFAEAQAVVVAKNVAREFTGRGEPARFDGFGQCFVETGDGRAGYGAGDFYAEPLPNIVLRAPSRRWHYGKVLFEKRWLWGRF